MKLYKFLDEQCAIEYLLTGRIRVASVGDRYGVILFSSARQFDHIPVSGVMLEFDTIGDLTLARTNCFRESDRALQVNLGDCEKDGSLYMYRLWGDFKLVSVALSHDCKKDWRFVRSCLKKLSKGDVTILCLQVCRDGNKVYVDEEYRMGADGLYCLKWNVNRPSSRDRLGVVDVD